MQLLDQVVDQARTKHYSPKTIRCYVAWLEQFLRFIRRRDGRWVHPKDLGATDVEAFLTDLAVRKRSAASTQNQALNAIVFVYRDVLKIELGDFSAVRSKRPARLPTVLSREEVSKLLEALKTPEVGANGAVRLMVGLMYGAGLRVSEVCGLRLMDVDFGRGMVMVRSGKGGKDRVTPLPARGGGAEGAGGACREAMDGGEVARSAGRGGRAGFGAAQAAERAARVGVAIPVPVGGEAPG